MKPHVIPHFPESGTRCSEIVLTVRIAYEHPFVAPGEWNHDLMLEQLVGDEPLEHNSIKHYNVNCASHVEWAELRPIRYSPGFDQSVVTTTQAQEHLYRDYCQDNFLLPTQNGFWLFVLKTVHGVEITEVQCTL